ncbi:AraC family transcriptional regulator [Sphingomonas sp. YR710]|uniref:AraC family transcriptional regulator n=1 Tax=Sphingomonas sp. YR710 TaxID=1882773 RepID=UPI00088725C9|nr:AraC family transcriptional regulator [Sphingomonas sp. YR710]SDC05880.1 AraC family transcriptional regulator [Sphingomonas sp. YR710]
MPSRISLELAFTSPTPPLARLPRDWRGFSAEYVDFTSDAPFEFRNLGDSHYLALHDIALRDGELKIDGLTRRNTLDLRDTITFVPRGCEVSGWSDPVERSNSFVAMYFDPEVIREDLGARYMRAEPGPFAYARNAPLRDTLKKLEAVIREPEIDELHAESLCLLASLEIFGVMADAQGRLSDRQVTAVTEFVEAQLHKPIGLSDMAAVAGLSRFHFSRAFKATTGENPHGFVQRRRIARAANLLTTSDLSIEAIALVVGFAGASQFRRVFRDQMGISPLSYRLQRR